MTKPLFKLTLVSILLTAVVVMLGAYTRLADAGLGCPDWPGCYGFISVPESAEHIRIAEERFPDAPVEVEKGWPEMVHRYFASTLGLFIMVLAFLSWRLRNAKDQATYSQAIKDRNTQNRSIQSPTGDDQPLKLPLLLLALVVCQGLFGMWTVTLKLWPQVVTAHLLGGFTTISLLVLLALRLSNTKLKLNIEQKAFWQTMRPFAAVVLFLVVGQITLGGWTSSNYAALACPDLPTCQGQWLPKMNLAEGFNVTQAIGPNYLGGLMDNEARVAIHFSHRVGAILVTLATLFLVWQMITKGRGSIMRPLGIGLFSVLLVQISLGLSNIYWILPLPIAVAHNAVGALLLLTLITINYYLFSLNAKYQ